MRLSEALNDLFATGSHVRVLRALDRLPRGVGVSGREVARRAGVSAPTARGVLASLADQGVLRVERSLKNASHRFNEDHVLVKPIRLLFERERSVQRELERDVGVALGRHRDVQAAYLFGSAARGDMLPKSDIDIAVMSPRDLPEDDAQLERLYLKYGNRVRVIRLRRDRGKGLRERVRLEGKPLPIIGRR